MIKQVEQEKSHYEANKEIIGVDYLTKNQLKRGWESIAARTGRPSRQEFHFRLRARSTH